MGELVPDGGCTLVSGTNGKTTTTALTAAALGSAGCVITNAAGANLRSGIANALVGSTGEGVAVLEVDEGAFPRTVRELRPDVVVLLNLSRDQLDRYAEVRNTADRWRAALHAAPETHVVANADDPLIAWAAGAAASVSWVSGGCAWLEDASTCPHCTRPLLHAPEGWACECGFGRPRVDPPAVTVEPEDIALPGHFNVRNATMAVAAASRLGIDAVVAKRSLSAVRDVSGRYGTIQVGATSARLLLVKNPAAWLEVLDLLEDDPERPLVLLLSSEIADGRDPSWVWDVPFRRLRRRHVFVGGPRSADLAVRLGYAEVAHIRMDGPASKVIEAAGAVAPAGVVDVAATYSMFAALARRGG
jgi:UDP-N-acetylmuramyl tripeptide synthase